MGNVAGASARCRCAAGLDGTGCVAARTGVGRPRLRAGEWYTHLTPWRAAALHFLARGGEVGVMRALKRLKPVDIDAMPDLARLAAEVRSDGADRILRRSSVAVLAAAYARKQSWARPASTSGGSPNSPTAPTTWQVSGRLGSGCTPG